MRPSIEKLGNSRDLSKFYPPRPKESHKGDFGRVGVAGGSETYAGCLVFNAIAALKAGADLAIIVAPRRAADVAAGYSPDLITVPCATPYPDPRVAEKQFDRADALVIGCGVQRTNSAHTALLSIIRRFKGPIVVDAEALHALAAKPNVARGKQLLLTPNAGEFQVLTGRPWPKSEQERIKAARALARKYRAVVIVKGGKDVISDGQRSSLDLHGSPYMTKGGYGDLIAGVAGAILARGFGPFDAAEAGAYIVGRAGEVASSKQREGTLVSDVLAQIPTVISRPPR